MALSYHAVDKPCPMGSSGPLAVQPADDSMDDCTDVSCRQKVTPAQSTGTEEAEAAVETTQTLVQGAARKETQTAARAWAPGYSEAAMNRMMR